MKRVIITAPMLGLCHMQVCAAKDATNKEILATCNAGNPSGTSHGWAKVIRRTPKKDANLRPVACEKYPDRRHFLVSC